jgi:hypothetical protein
LRETIYKDDKSNAYVGNGVLIIAMLISGFEYKLSHEDSPNAYFKLSYQSVKNISDALSTTEQYKKEILAHDEEFAKELPIYKYL